MLGGNISVVTELVGANLSSNFLEFSIRFEAVLFGISILSRAYENAEGGKGNTRCVLSIMEIVDIEDFRRIFVLYDELCT